MGQGGGVVTGSLTLTQPFPPARPLPDAYDRHHPEVGPERAVVAGLVEGIDWAGLGWPALVQELIALGRTDVPLARLTEGHVDALKIIDQAGAVPEPGALYGVWASRSARTGLTVAEDGDHLRLDGTLRFASGAGLVDHALVPGWFDEHRSVLLDLDVTGLPVDASVWRTAAMAPSRTYEVRVADLAVPRSAQRGAEGFYLSRRGFWAGGLGVSACWVGGAARVLDTLLAMHPGPRPAQQVRLGRIRADLVAAASAVRTAAVLLEDPEVDTRTLALEVRTVVAEAVHRVLANARLLTGPTGLALDDAVAHVVPDLELYVLQHDVDGAHAALGAPDGWP